ncbi:hypothetical protein HanRHA438_Chr01g0032501 [Helianthus annuus]|nr:hypothetical protein HanRHA438_Chr01g0032501 [Helianthus annuus]
MVSFNSGEEVDRFSLLAKEKCDRFHSVEKWVGQTLPFERLAWLRVQGIPLHLLDNAVINKIGERFEKVMQGGQHDIWDSNLSYDYVGVLVSEGKRIQEEVIVQWKGRRYTVWVEEQIDDWEPEFLGKDRGVGAALMTNSQSQSSEPEDQGNRDQSQPSGNLTGDCPSRVLERPQLSYVIMEGAVNDQSENLGKFEVTKNMGDIIEADKETFVNYGEVFLGGNYLERERGSP